MSEQKSSNGCAMLVAWIALGWLLLFMSETCRRFDKVEKRLDRMEKAATPQETKP